MRTEGGGPALFRLVRFWSRRWAAGAGGAPAHVLVLEAIDAVPGGGIADVAVELGLDRSNASRMLSDAVRAGLVAKATAPEDARRTTLALTDAGRELLAAARAWQEETFAALVAGWPDDEAERLAAGLRRLASQLPPGREP